MTRDTWSARIVRDDVLGCGFLISPTQVLTCRHVVEEYAGEEWTVAFPDAGPQSQERVGTVTILAADVDVAVLTLDRPVGITPARLATFHALHTSHERPDLRAYGFPKRVGPGVQVMLTAMPELSASGLVQVYSEHGPPLVTGFSGSPVFRTDDMKVVGMVAEADRDNRAGRIVPVDVLCRIVPGLAERIDLGDAFPAPAYAELAAVLNEGNDGARSPSLLDGVTECRPKRRLTSPLAQIEFLATEDPRGPEAIRGAVLTALLRVQAARPDLEAPIGRWLGRHLLPTHAVPPTVPPAANQAGPLKEPPWVLVAIDLSASPRGGYMVQGWCVLSSDECLPIGDGLAEVPEARLEEHVLDLVDDGLDRIPVMEGQPLPVVEFILKRKLLLDAEVDHWGESVPLGWDYPVVVRDLDGFRRPPRKLREQWVHLRPKAAEGDPVLDWLGCVESADREHVLNRVRWPDRPRGLALHSLPSSDVLNAAIGGGVPVMVWTRHRCPADDHDLDDDPCAGRRFRKTLDVALGAIDGTVLSGLREAVMKLRLKAGTGKPMWGREIVIMWDDPERRPPAVLEKLR
jgi:hypothetical protein